MTGAFIIMVKVSRQLPVAKMISLCQLPNHLPDVYSALELKQKQNYNTKYKNDYEMHFNMFSL